MLEPFHGANIAIKNVDSQINFNSNSRWMQNIAVIEFRREYQSQLDTQGILYVLHNDTVCVPTIFATRKLSTQAVVEPAILGLRSGRATSKPQEPTLIFFPVKYSV
ncbi:hypothetical protein TNCV_4787121 [Trichonephila clavipes]|nr:hypothetical protein TNCV_4787121 [Trichonephila clavipes]